MQTILSILYRLLEFVSSVAWPLALVVIVFCFRGHLKNLLHTLNSQMALGANFKLKDFEFNGIRLGIGDDKAGQGFGRVAAERELKTTRDQNYNAQKNLFLVHRVRPTGETHRELKVPTYDVLIYLYPHRSFGALNDVKEVEYYFGHYFGQSVGQYGTKYVVKNGSEAFAVKISAYGPTLCEAKILFHDGTSVITSRYLDFEGTGYKFDPNTTAIDKRATELETKKRKK